MRHGFPEPEHQHGGHEDQFQGDTPDLRAWEATTGLKTRLSRFRPSGNARRVWDEYRLDRGQLGELSQFLSAHKEVLTGDSFFSITARDRRELGLNMCGAAKMTCSVAPDGTVYPCAFLQDPVFRAGNITDESLESIWQYATPFEALRSVKIASCEECGRFSLCHGGCPAVAYFLTQSLDRRIRNVWPRFRRVLWREIH